MDLQAETDRLRLNFLTAELELSGTFADIAGFEEANGEREHAERSLADAGRGYQVVSGFLSDPKHSARLSGEQLSRLQDRLEALGRAIDVVKQALARSSSPGAPLHSN